MSVEHNCCNCDLYTLNNNPKPPKVCTRCGGTRFTTVYDEERESEHEIETESDNDD